MADLLYSIRGSFGFSLRRGVKDGGTEVMGLALDPKVNLVKCLKFSDDGVYMAYCDSVRTAVVEVNSGKELFSTDLPKTCEIFFSPRSTYMVTYQLYVIWGTRKNEDGTDRVPDPNLRIWSVPDGKLLATIIANKQSLWRPQFTDDERLMFRLQGSELLVYDAPNFERYVRKVVVKDLAQFLLSSGADPYLACFIPSLKGHPALIQLRQSSDELPVIQTKTTFHGTSCAMSWNSKGSAVLVCATEEVDKSNKSYYGSSMMYCIPVRRDAFKVDLDKNGPIYSYEWSPDSRHFCVCYGYMPSKVTVFNVKGEVTWALGEGHRNEVHYNQFGNILAVCAFGNISSGKVQFWDVAKNKLINSLDINCTTHFAWAPDGQHFYAATTAPRLRINNCYRLFDYRNNVLHDRLYEKEELWEVAWCPVSRNAYASFEIEYPVAGEDKPCATSVYRSGATPLQNCDVGKLPDVDAVTSEGRYVPPALRGKKKETPHVEPGTESDGLVKGAVAIKTKRCKDLRRKLEEIKKLKQRQDRGEKLELNQQFKIQCEERYGQELSELTLAIKEESSTAGDNRS